MIDIHTHFGRIMLDKKPLKPYQLLQMMDREGIEKAVVLPIENPEEAYFYVTTEEVLKGCKRYPERLIPFCNVDPRRGASDTTTKFYEVIKEYVDRGCRGFGEALSGLWIDDPRLQKIYSACSNLKIPILIHLDNLRNLDELGMPRFEKMIKKFPQLTFIGHGPHFWAEISSRVTKDEIGAYPKGEIKEGGAAGRLLKRYPNLYGDLSAGSGYNALARDKEFAYKFLKDYQDKLLYGSDYLYLGQPIPQLEFLRGAKRERKISETAFKKITYRNARRILFGVKSYTK